MIGQSKETMTLISNLEKWRNEHGYSMNQFAQMIGLNKSTYSKLVNGDTYTLHLDTLHNIYNVTGYLCYQLMEVFTDDYLILCNMIRDFSLHEMKCMRQFIEVYIETKRRVQDDN